MSKLNPPPNFTIPRITRITYIIPHLTPGRVIYSVSERRKEVPYSMLLLSSTISLLKEESSRLVISKLSHFNH